MAKLTYSMFTSLDGYTEDRARRLWLGRSRRRRVALLHQRACVVIRHLSLRTEDVRDNGELGDRAHGSRSTTVRARLCQAVAGGGEDRVLQDPRRAAQAIRASLVDEFQMIVCPVVVGNGKRFFPDGVRLNSSYSRSDASV